MERETIEREIETSSVALHVEPGSGGHGNGKEDQLGYPISTVISLAASHGWDDISVLGSDAHDVKSIGVTVTASVPFTLFLVKGNPEDCLSSPVWSESRITRPENVFADVRSEPWGNLMMVKFNTSKCHIRIGNGGDLFFVIAFCHQNSNALCQMDVSHSAGWSPVMAKIPGSNKQTLTHGGPHELGATFALNTSGSYGIVRMIPASKVKKIRDHLTGKKKTTPKKRAAAKKKKSTKTKKAKKSGSKKTKVKSKKSHPKKKKTTKKRTSKKKTATRKKNAGKKTKSKKSKKEEKFDPRGIFD